MKSLVKKPRKPRTKEQPQAFMKTHCPYDDDTKWKECNNPWADKCDGNIHKCMKLKQHHLASLSEKKRREYLARELENTRRSDERRREFREYKEIAKEYNESLHFLFQ